jgi:hypothetical protein
MANIPAIKSDPDQLLPSERHQRGFSLAALTAPA